MARSFVHLQVHSEYAIVDGMMSPSEVVAAAKSNGMPAVALTDFQNTYGSLKFYQAALQQGIKPIIGAEVALTGQQGALQGRLLLLCQDFKGFQQLSVLMTSISHGQEAAALSYEALTPAACDHLIAISIGVQADFVPAMLSNQDDEVRARLKHWATVFPRRFYLGMTQMNRAEEARVNHQLLRWSSECVMPIVALNGVCFAQQSDFNAHQIRVCINRSEQLPHMQRALGYTEAQYFKSSEDMYTAFAQYPEACMETLRIAQRCSCCFDTSILHLPAFPYEGDLNGYFIEQIQSGLVQRLSQRMIDDACKAQYEARLLHEQEVIIKMGFVSYFLIVADLIQWAKRQGIPVGPGRGSGAGSLVAYALKITDIDPIDYQLLFERFLNVERVSMPDFDIDFCVLRRDEVLAYVANRYGAESVAQIVTFGTLAARAVIRDVGRVLGHPYGFVDQLAKLIPNELGIDLERAIEKEPRLKQRIAKESEVAQVLNYAKKLEGVTRNVGRHAGGLVISPQPLVNYMPLSYDAEAAIACTHFDKDDLERIGLVKFDLLGLKNLSIIQAAVDQINEDASSSMTIDAIDLADQKTFDLFKKGDTAAVFQLEAPWVKEIIKRLGPDCFDDLVALVALIRPGPLQAGMTDDYIDRKRGRKGISYFHEALEPVLKPTYGVIIYQEQVMHIAQVLGGYTLGHADLLRRAMGKKKPEEMAKHRSQFVQGATDKGVDEALAMKLFDLMEKFAGYAFNKSHSVAYALIAYQTAWLKAHYPAAFMAAVLSSDSDHTDKIQRNLMHCKQLDLQIDAPDINQSSSLFKMITPHQMHYGLASLKGVGIVFADAIVKERLSKGPYRDFFDFCCRTVPYKVNKKVLESLVAAGAFDSLHDSRSCVYASIERGLLIANQVTQRLRTGQQDLFSLLPQSNQPVNQAQLSQVDPWLERQQLQEEYKAFGFYFSGHPLDKYQVELEGLGVTVTASIDQEQRGPIRIAGLVQSFKIRRSASGNQFATFICDDGQGLVQVSLLGRAFKAYVDALSQAEIVLIDGIADWDDFTASVRVNVQHVFCFDHILTQYVPCLKLVIESIYFDQVFALLKQCLLAAERGPVQIMIDYIEQGYKETLSCSAQWSVKPSSELMSQLEAIEGLGVVGLCYPKIEPA